MQTQILQDLVARAFKACTLQPLLPTTTYMQVKVAGDKLYVRSTDNVNSLTLSVETNQPDFEMVVDAKVFAAIIAKITTSEISLIVEDMKVTIEGNGKYNMAYSTDVDGSKVVFPEPVADLSGVSVTVSGQELKSIIELNKPCKADSKEVPCMFNYYAFSDGVITTNEFKACFNPVKLTNSPISIPANVMDLAMEVISGKGEVNIYQTEKSIIFKSDDAVLIAEKASQADVDKFPAENLLEVFAMNAELSTKLNRTTFLQTVERIALFTEAYEQDKLTIIFNQKSVELQSAGTGSTEIVDYIADNENILPADTNVKVFVDAKYLKTIISACNEEQIIVKFGTVDGVQIHCGNVKIILGALD